MHRKTPALDVDSLLDFFDVSIFERFAESSIIFKLEKRRVQAQQLLEILAQTAQLQLHSSGTRLEHQQSSTTGITAGSIEPSSSLILFGAECKSKRRLAASLFLVSISPQRSTTSNKSSQPKIPKFERCEIRNGHDFEYIYCLSHDTCCYTQILQHCCSVNTSLSFSNHIVDTYKQNSKINNGRNGLKRR